MNDTFTLPDGTKAGTGNIRPDQLPKGLFKSFDSTFKLLEDAEVKGLLIENGEQRYLKLRQQREYCMINQDSVGKCNASAFVAGLYQVRGNNGHDQHVIADNYMYWNINGGKDQGSLLHHGMVFGKETGVAPRQLTTRDGEIIGNIDHLAYNKRQVPANIMTAANEQAARFRAHEPYTLPEDWAGFRQTVMTALALDFPIVMAWDVSNNSMRLNRDYIVSGRGMGNHASLWHSAKWVGGRDGVHPDLKNSWGPTLSPVYGPPSQGWGNGGYGLMTMEQAFHCRQWHEFYVLTGCTEDGWNSIL